MGTMSTLGYRCQVLFTASLSEVQQIRGLWPQSSFSPAQISRGRDLPGRQPEQATGPTLLPLQSTIEQSLLTPKISWEGAMPGEQSLQACSVPSYFCFLELNPVLFLYQLPTECITWFLRFSTSPNCLLSTAGSLLFSFFPSCGRADSAHFMDQLS